MQLESARKKNDMNKVQVLEMELEAVSFSSDNN